MQALPGTRYKCLDDFDIPLKLSHTITRIVGNERVEGVYVARVDENRKPMKETEEYIECDTLLLSVGLILKMKTDQKSRYHHIRHHQRPRGKPVYADLGPLCVCLRKCGPCQ